MTSSRYVVQFLHPGSEHQPSGRAMGWNRDSHRRKFLIAPGRAVRDKDQYSGELGFWGEWEPQSDVEPIEEPVPGGPTYAHRPFYRLPATPTWRQNTDPCVFGGFRYTCCQQHFKGRPNSMQFLAAGSLILFGSSISGDFVLDTAFVTRDEGIPHDSATYIDALRTRAPEPYFDVTLRPWYSDAYEPNRYYQGATADDPYEGMYSFVPAVPWSGRSSGFPRPRVRISGVITGNQRQGRKMTAVDAARAHQIWKDVVRQVISARAWLGVYADWPQHR